MSLILGRSQLVVTLAIFASACGFPDLEITGTGGSGASSTQTSSGSNGSGSGNGTGTSTSTVSASSGGESTSTGMDCDLDGDDSPADTPTCCPSGPCDCHDSNGIVFPEQDEGQTASYTKVGGGQSFDYNCDGSETPIYPYGGCGTHSTSICTGVVEDMPLSYDDGAGMLSSMSCGKSVPIIGCWNGSASCGSRNLPLPCL